jgi:hypothetical protein
VPTIVEHAEMQDRLFGKVKGGGVSVFVFSQRLAALHPFQRELTARWDLTMITPEANPSTMTASSWDEDDRDAPSVCSPASNPTQKVAKTHHVDVKP